MRSDALHQLNRGAVVIDGVAYVVTMIKDAYGENMLHWEIAKTGIDYAT